MMRRIYGGTQVWLQISKRFGFNRASLCSTANKPPNGEKVGEGDGSLRQFDAYRDLDKLDFMTAAQILFVHPPKKKKYGLDFHLVQLFFACMPSLAVYLVAQYARYEMRRMDAELEAKKKVEDEAKAKEMEKLKAEKKEDPEISEVKERLVKLEEVVKEFVVESKKQTNSINKKDEESKLNPPTLDSSVNEKNSSGNSADADEKK